MAKLNFTKAAIDGLPIPEKGWAYHYDLKVQGLGIGIGKTGKKTFILYRKINGTPERLTLGRYPDLTIEQARGKASEINAAIANGSNPADAKRGRVAELTFGELFSQYIERHAKQHKRTWAEDKQRFEQYLQRPLAKKKLGLVDRQLVASIHSEITFVGHPVVANRVLALVSSVYGWAISAGLVEVNPITGIKRNREKSRDRFLQSDELPRFFKAVAEEENATMRDYFLLSLLTGARRANVLAMRWSEVNFDRAEWRIKETKNGTPQTVTLSPEAIEILRNRLPSEATSYVFPGSGKSGHLAEPKKGWQRILARAGISDLRIHDLRRTLGSWQAKQGASLAIIGKSLNHKNQNTTAIYARLDLDPVRNSVNTATSAMMVAAGLKSEAGTAKNNSGET
ncbi:tyrosine-type recombinase/integrase [Nitrosospira briensis]|uniref:tyrosine-type recombinase/integrase n=1 Tax=Nitrosospira briensis TaxID=35799 RepID=UPI0008F2C54E|nr:site-specific integrase [Nitrosospira briensis]SFO38822.1 Site-specific recombinase XerD [Nitrosospira briensis]